MPVTRAITLLPIMLPFRDIQLWVWRNLDTISLAVLVSIVYLNISDILIKHHGLPGINKALVPLLLLLTLFYQYRRNWSSRGLQITILVAILWFGFQSGTALYANYLEHTRSATSELLKHLLIMIAASGLVLKVSSLKYLAWSLLGSGAFIGLLSLLAFLSGDINQSFGGLQRWGVDIDSYGNVVSSRIGGQIGDPNFYAQVLLMVLPTGLVFAFNEASVREKAAAGFCSVVIIAAVLCTLSRGGWLMLAVLMSVFLVALVIFRGLTSRMSQSIILATIVLFTASPFFLSEQIKERFSTLFQTAESALYDGVVTDGAISGRVDEMRVAVHAFAEHPLLGLGYNNSKYHYQDYARQQGLTARGTDRSTHSLYLQILAEGGIIGFLIFLGIAYITIRCALYACQVLSMNGNGAQAWYIRGFLLGYLAYLGAGFVLHAGFPRYFWLLTGLLLSSLNLISFKSVSDTSASGSATNKQHTDREAVWKEQQA